MKIRAQKSNYNTKPDFQDFLLKEFSLDKENFVHDPSLSCNHCYAQESLALYQDSVPSFLVKFKASLLADPGCIKPGVKGFILPEDGYKFTKTASTLHFTSINQNHYEMNLNSVQARAAASVIYNDPKRIVDIPKADVTDYLVKSCRQTEWTALHQKADRTNWKKHLKNKVREKYKAAYGKFDDADISQAMTMDQAGVQDLVAILRLFAFLEPHEIQAIDRHVP